MQGTETASELNITTDTQWVLFELDNQLFGFGIEHVREMVLMPDLAEVPKTPDYILGVTNLRGSTIAVIDLRIRLGMKSLAESRQDLADLLNARKQDHIDWLAELKASVREGREFTKATDPHKCAFGKWYDTFRTDDLELASLLKKFDEPHQVIHGIADTVKGLEKEGKTDEAEELMASTESRELKTMLDLFDSVVSVLLASQRRITVIVEMDGQVCGMTVDSVESVVTLKPDEINAAPEFSAEQSSDAVIGVAHPKGFDRMVLLLEPGKILEAGELKLIIPK